MMNIQIIVFVITLCISGVLIYFTANAIIDSIDVSAEPGDGNTKNVETNPYVMPIVFLVVPLCLLVMLFRERIEKYIDNLVKR